MIYQIKSDFIQKNENLRKKIAQQGKKKYFQLFNDVRVSKYIIDISLGVNAKLI